MVLEVVHGVMQQRRQPETGPTVKDIRDIGCLTTWQVWILDIWLWLTRDIGHLTIFDCMI